MHPYAYETHAHTSGASRCGKISPRELVRLYARLQYAGVFITNHFGGRKQQPWQERVELLHTLYTEALAEGKKLGVDVFFAWEYSCTHAHDFLTYGLDETWLYNHPKIQDMTTTQYLRFARDSGGFVVHAHPFREDKNDVICLRPHDVDAVEVLNTGREDAVNRLAAQYAADYRLPGFAGSDTHSSNKDCFAGICFAEKITDTKDMLARFQNGEGELFYIPDSSDCKNRQPYDGMKPITGRA